MAKITKEILKEILLKELAANDSSNPQEAVKQILGNTVSRNDLYKSGAGRINIAWLVDVLQGHQRGDDTVTFKKNYQVGKQPYIISAVDKDRLFVYPQKVYARPQGQSFDFEWKQGMSGEFTYVIQDKAWVSGKYPTAMQQETAEILAKVIKVYDPSIDEQEWVTKFTAGKVDNLSDPNNITKIAEAMLLNNGDKNAVKAFVQAAE